MTDVAPPEFSRPIALRQITGQPLVLEANEQERTGLARRLAITSVDRLVARVALDRQGERVGVTGTLKADITQPCAVSGEDFSVHIAEDIALRFVPEGSIRPSLQRPKISTRSSMQVKSSISAKPSHSRWRWRSILMQKDRMPKRRARRLGSSWTMRRAGRWPKRSKGSVRSNRHGASSHLSRMPPASSRSRSQGLQSASDCQPDPQIFPDFSSRRSDTSP